MDDLVKRLEAELPKVGERETVWCMVQGCDLREAAIEITRLRTLVDSYSVIVRDLRALIAADAELATTQETLQRKG